MRDIGDKAYMDKIGEGIHEILDDPSLECGNHCNSFDRLEFVYRKYRELEQRLKDLEGVK